MTTDQQKRAEELLDRLAEVPAARREEELSRQCPEDPEVRQEVTRRLERVDQPTMDVTGIFERLRAGVLPVSNQDPFDPSATDALPVSPIGPYHILEKLGDGGFGSVYKAEQRHPLRRVVALKIIKLGFDTKEVVARFNSERQALARMDHPHIAKVLDAGSTAAGKPYFVMDYVAGAPITRFCDENRLTIEQRLQLFRQICGAITHAHQKALIHRDIKAGNVLAFMHDGRPEAKVIDFGIAKALTPDRLTDLTFNTAQGVAIGTYESMSPEQAAGSPDIDTRTDVYSLGVLLYELLAGVPPYDRASLAKATHADACRIIRDVETPNPSAKLRATGEAVATHLAERRQTDAAALARRLSRELEWIPLKAMRKERERRYPSPQHLADDIENYLTGRPLFAGPETHLYRWRKTFRRHAGAITAVASVILALVLGIVATSVQSIRAQHAERTARGAQARSVDAEREARQAESHALQLADDNGRLALERSAALESANNQLGLALLEKSRRLTSDGDTFAAAMTAAFATGFDGDASGTASLKTYRLLRPDTPDWREALDLSAIRPATRLLWRSPAGVHHAGAVRGVAFAPDGSTIASTSEDGTVRVWDMASGRLRTTFDAHAGAVTSLCFSPDGATLVTDAGAMSKSAAAWDVANGKPLQLFVGHLGPVRAVAYSPDGKRVATASADRTVRLWNAVTSLWIATLTGHARDVVCVAFSRDGATLASASLDDTIRLWDVASGKPLQTLQAPHAVATGGLSFSADGKTLAFASADNAICLWEIGTASATRSLSGHTAAITSLCFGGDGKSIATSSLDGSVRVWDAASGQATLVLGDNLHATYGVSFSPGDKMLGWGSRDNRIHLRDLTRGDSPQQFSGIGDVVTGVSFSPDGKTLASASRDNAIWLWDAASGEPRQTLRGDSAVATSAGSDPRSVRVVFSPDGHSLAAAAPESLTLWNGEESRRFPSENPTSGEAAVAFSADGRLLASACGDSAITVRDTTTRNTLQTLRGHTDAVTSVSFSPDGTMLASASNDKTVRLWDVATGQSRPPIAEHTREVTAVAFSPDGSILASGSADDTVRLTVVSSGRLLHALQHHTLTVTDVRFSPDGRTLATASADGTVKLWDVASGQELQTLGRVNGDRITSVSFSPDGSRLAAGAADSTVSVWEVNADRPRQTIGGHTNWVSSVTFNRDGSAIASGSYDHTLQLLDVPAGTRRIDPPRGHTQEVYTVAFNRQGTVLASGGNDRVVRLWDGVRGTRLRELSPVNGGILAVAFSPDGGSLAAGSRDHAVYLWDLAKDKPPTVLTGHADGVYAVAFSPDGRLLASGSRDQTIRLWDVASGTERQQLTGHHDRVSGVCFSPDGNTLVSSSYDHTLRLWDVKSGQTIRSFTAAGKNRNWITSLQFSPDGSTVAFSADDGVLRLWEPATGREIEAMRNSGEQFFSVSFSPDGRTLATGSNDNMIRLWDIRPPMPLRQYLQAYRLDGVDVVALPAVNLYGDGGFRAHAVGGGNATLNAQH